MPTASFPTEVKRAEVPVKDKEERLGVGKLPMPSNFTVSLPSSAISSEASTLLLERVPDAPSEAPPLPRFDPTAV